MQSGDILYERVAISMFPELGENLDLIAIGENFIETRKEYSLLLHGSEWWFQGMCFSNPQVNEMLLEIF